MNRLWNRSRDVSYIADATSGVHLTGATFEPDGQDALDEQSRDAARRDVAAGVPDPHAGPDAPDYPKRLIQQAFGNFSELAAESEFATRGRAHEEEEHQARGAAAEERAKDVESDLKAAEASLSQIAGDATARVRRLRRFLGRHPKAMLLALWAAVLCVLVVDVIVLRLALEAFALQDPEKTVYAIFLSAAVALAAILPDRRLIKVTAIVTLTGAVALRWWWLTGEIDTWYVGLLAFVTLGAAALLMFAITHWIAEIRLETMELVDAEARVEELTCLASDLRGAQAQEATLAGQAEVPRDALLASLPDAFDAWHAFWLERLYVYFEERARLQPGQALDLETVLRAELFALQSARAEARERFGSVSPEPSRTSEPN